MIINDRIDIALAVGADGVHLGQTDMPVEVARKLLPAGANIGISCSTREEVEIAASAGADYVGIGPIYGTSTKMVKTPLVGPRNLGDILVVLENTNVKSVAIGTLHQSVCDITPTCTQVESNQQMQYALFSGPSRPLENRSMVLL